jgi:hypothetical protein
VSGIIALDFDAIRSHSSRVRTVADELGQTGSIASLTGISVGAFGVLCSNLGPAATIVATLAREAIIEAGELVQRSADGISEVADEFADFEEAARVVFDQMESYGPSVTPGRLAGVPPLPTPDGGPPSSLVAGPAELSTPFAGAFLLEDLEALNEAIRNEDWLAEGMASFALALDGVAAVSDPIGTLIAMGLGWVLEHLEPLREWMNDLTGDAGEVAGFAATWHNVEAHMSSSADRLQDSMIVIEDANGVAIGAYRAFQDDVIKHVRGAGEVAGAMAGALEICSTIVKIVHDIVRDALAAVVGSLVSYALEFVSTLGLATPAIIEQATTRVASLLAPLARMITKLLKAVRALIELLRKLGPEMTKLAELFRRLLREGRTPEPKGKDLDPWRQLPARKPPSVLDPNLQNRIKAAFIRDSAEEWVGDGTVMDAIRYELETGERVGGRNHVEKGQQIINSLNNWLRRNPDGLDSDKAAARKMIEEIQSALDGN